jgi:hypothetical protein
MQGLFAEILSVSPTLLEGIRNPREAKVLLDTAILGKNLDTLVRYFESELHVELRIDEVRRNFAHRDPNLSCVLPFLGQALLLSHGNIEHIKTRLVHTLAELHRCEAELANFAALNTALSVELDQEAPRLAKEKAAMFGFAFTLR